MSPVRALALLVVPLAFPGCVTLVTHLGLTRPDPVAPREVAAVRTGAGEVHVRAAYDGLPPAAWRLRPPSDGDPSPAERVAARGPLPDGRRLTASRACLDGPFEVRDGEAVVGYVEADAERPAPAWRAGLAWALTPLTLVADVATLWVQVPWVLYAVSTEGLVSTADRTPVLGR